MEIIIPLSTSNWRLKVVLRRGMWQTVFKVHFPHFLPCKFQSHLCGSPLPRQGSTYMTVQATLFFFVRYYFEQTKHIFVQLHFADRERGKRGRWSHLVGVQLPVCVSVCVWEHILIHGSMTTTEIPLMTAHATTRTMTTAESCCGRDREWERGG